MQLQIKLVLSAAKDIQGEDFRYSVLAAIAPQLAQAAPKLLEQALSVAKDFQNEDYRSKALAAIAPQLPQTYLPHLLAAISGLSKENAAQVLISPAVQFTEALAVQFPRDKHIVALEVVKVLSQGTDKTKFLSALAPQLPVGLLPSALRLIQDAFTEDADRAEAFSNLIPYLTNNQLSEAFNLITQSIRSPHHFTTTLENLIPYLSVEKFSEILSSLSHDAPNLLEEKSNHQTF